MFPYFLIIQNSSLGYGKDRQKYLKFVESQALDVKVNLKMKIAQIEWSNGRYDL